MLLIPGRRNAVKRRSAGFADPRRGRRDRARGSRRAPAATRPPPGECRPRRPSGRPVAEPRPPPQRTWRNPAHCPMRPRAGTGHDPCSVTVGDPPARDRRAAANAARGWLGRGRRGPRLVSRGHGVVDEPAFGRCRCAPPQRHEPLPHRKKRRAAGMGRGRPQGAGGDGRDRRVLRPAAHPPVLDCRRWRGGLTPRAAGSERAVAPGDVRLMAGCGGAFAFGRPSRG